MKQDKTKLEGILGANIIAGTERQDLAADTDTIPIPVLNGYLYLYPSSTNSGMISIPREVALTGTKKQG